MLSITEWGDYLLIFRGNKYEHPHEHLLNFHKCMLEHDFVHKDVLIKMFRFYLEEHAHEWCQSLPTASIHSLKEFHIVFHHHYQIFYPKNILFENCCEEYELHDEIEDIDREELIPHNLHQFSNDIQDDRFSHKYELEVNNEEVEGSVIIINSDYYKLEDLVSLDTKHND